MYPFERAQAARPRNEFRKFESLDSVVVLPVELIPAFCSMQVSFRDVRPNRAQSRYRSLHTRPVG